MRSVISYKYPFEKCPSPKIAKNALFGYSENINRISH